ncbi:MAG: amidohydrolase family protein [Fusobacteriaceae bacterium]|nr:amidohydrolase family protein [Fusobacteriaceae bacterium]
MLLIKNCKLILGEFKEAITGVIKDLESVQDIFIYNEKIIKIKSNLKIDESFLKKYNIENFDKESLEVIDANFNYVIPGVIDVHTHMRDPGLTEKEDFTTGSKACAKGGVTTFIDMPNTIPQTTTEEFLKIKSQGAEGRSYVDYGFHFGGSNGDNSSEILKVKDRVASTKIFLNMSTGDMLINNNSSLENIFKSSKIISVHAEGEKVEEAIKLGIAYDKPVYLCHISQESEVDIIKKYKSEIKEMNKKVKIYVEVAPHHLFLNEEIKNQSELNKKLLIMKPELKGAEDNKALLQGIKDGVIDTIGTDHAPHTLKDKETKLTFGIPGVENSLEVMLNLVKRDEITLYRLTKLMSENPADIFEISNKGRIQEGYDADLVILDMNNMYTISNKEVVSKCGWTPYNNFLTGGKVQKTILRGHVVYSDNEFSNSLIGKEIEYNIL